MQALEQEIKTGRRTKRPVDGYRREYAEQARKLCLLLGATDEELAGFFDVSSETVKSWLAVVPAFAAAVQAGKDLADAEIADRLYRRALGYSHEAVRIFNHQGTPLKVPYVEHFPPDTSACIFWLKSRQRDKWRDKIEHEHHAVSELLDCLDAAGERAKNARRG
jgi:hypothetical protein